MQSSIFTIPDFIGNMAFADIQPLTYHQRRGGMQSVKVNKIKLTTILNGNRSKHKQAYREAVLEYRKALRAKLEDLVASLKPINTEIDFQTDLKSLSVSLPAPKHHLKEYDLALGMLGMSVENEITLTSGEFSEYVNDEWNWKREFFATNALYGMDRMGSTTPDLG